MKWKREERRADKEKKEGRESDLNLFEIVKDRRKRDTQIDGQHLRQKKDIDKIYYNR